MFALGLSQCKVFFCTLFSFEQESSSWRTSSKLEKEAQKTSTVQRNESWRAKDPIWQVVAFYTRFNSIRATLDTYSLGRRDVGCLFVETVIVQVSSTWKFTEYTLFEIKKRNMYIFSRSRARLTRLTHGRWTCRWLTSELFMLMLTDWNSERVDIYIFSTESCHRTNMFVIRSWNGFHVSIQSNSYFLWLCIASVHDWLQNLAPFRYPIKSKIQTNRSLEFSRASPWLHAFALNCDWFIRFSVSFVIAKVAATLVFVLRQSLENRSIIILNGRRWVERAGKRGRDRCGHSIMEDNRWKGLQF